MRGILSIAVALVLCWCAWCSLRLARADHLFRRDTPESVARAASLAPGNARYRLRLADLDLASQRARHLEAAASLNPRLSSALIRLALHHETSADLRSAEARLLEAARIDHTFEPAWALANFYFRRERAEPFWRSTKAALAMSYGDRTAIFRLARRMGGDILPQSPAVAEQYVRFLLTEDDLETAVRIVRTLRPLPRALALDACDRLIEVRKVADAVDLWNLLVAERLLPYERLAPELGTLLTNGRLVAKPLSQGFDWRPTEQSGLAVARIDDALEITFAGAQPEAGELLSQYLPLARTRAYRLRFSAQAALSAPAGLRWRITTPGSNAEVAFNPGDDWRDETGSFIVAAGADLARLSLYYQRPAGAVRCEGVLRVRHLSVEPAQ